MEYRTFGNTVTAVSRIALGPTYFGSETPEEDAFKVIDAFLDAGVNHIDTSNVYVGGLTEEIIGRWFAPRPAEVTDTSAAGPPPRIRVPDPQHMNCHS